jgi:hypothetical protein
VTGRKIDVFFYGLFMDADVLPRRAYVADFAVRVGQRATLVPSPGARAYGMLFALTHGVLERLYNAPGLEQYYPEAVLAQLAEEGAIPALCYNLRQAPEPHERNPAYAARLQRVLEKLEFPAEYIASIG